MCLGKTIKCRSCRREDIRFYPGGRCGEVVPFPLWHVIRGHRRTVRRCHECIQSHIRSQVRAQEDAIRDARRAKSLGQYFRRERRHPLSDEEIHLQSNGDYMLQSFDLISEDEANGEANVDQNSTAQLSLHQESDAEQNPTEVNYWDDYRTGRRLHPFGEIAAREEFLFFQLFAQASPEIETLALLMTRLEECFARQEHISLTGRSIIEDDRQYIFESIRCQFEDQLAQLPITEPAETLIESFQGAPIAVEEEADDYREPEAPEMSFYEWTRRRYEQDPSHNDGLFTQDALEQDLDNYDWYLRRYCTDLQANDFHRRRAEIANREYEFDHPNLESVSFSQWLTIENRVRGRNGIESITCSIQALIIFCNEVIWQQSQEVRDAFSSSRIRYFEENRRELYGHARDEKCLLIERLRSVREESLQIMLWVESNLPDLFTAQKNLDQIGKILKTRIAMELEPTEEQWAEIIQIGRNAVEEIKEAQEHPDRGNRRNFYSQLTENWDHEYETQVGDVDDSDGEFHETLQVASGFLSQELQGEFEELHSREPGLLLDLSTAQADPDWSSSEAETDDDHYP